MAAEKAGIRTVHLRTGIVLSSEGGALKKQLPLFKLGLGGRFGNGHQWQSWISIDDEVGAIGHLLAVGDLRGGQPHGAGAGHQRRVHHDAGQGRAPPGSDPDPRLRARS